MSEFADTLISGGVVMLYSMFVWCEDRWQECAGGIHFFITREEAEAYDP